MSSLRTLIAVLALVCIIAVSDAHWNHGRGRRFGGRVRRFFSPNREFDLDGKDSVVVSKMALFHAQKIRKLAAFEECSKQISEAEKCSVDSEFFTNVISNGYDSIRNYLRNLKEQIHERIVLIRKVLGCVHSKPLIVVGHLKSNNAQVVAVISANMTLSHVYALSTGATLKEVLPKSKDTSFEELEGEFVEEEEVEFNESDDLAAEEVEGAFQADEPFADDDNLPEADFEEEEQQQETEFAEDDDEDDDDSDVAFEEEDDDDDDDDVQFEEASEDDSDDVEFAEADEEIVDNDLDFEFQEESDQAEDDVGY